METRLGIWGRVVPLRQGLAQCHGEGGVKVLMVGYEWGRNLLLGWQQAWPKRDYDPLPALQNYAFPGLASAKRRPDAGLTLWSLPCPSPPHPDALYRRMGRT